MDPRTQCIYEDHQKKRCPNDALPNSNYCATHSPDKRSTGGGGGGGGRGVLYKQRD